MSLRFCKRQNEQNYNKFKREWGLGQKFESWQRESLAKLKNSIHYKMQLFQVQHVSNQIFNLLLR